MAKRLTLMISSVNSRPMSKKELDRLCPASKRGWPLLTLLRNAGENKKDFAQCLID
jgi:hypothetical protein